MNIFYPAKPRGIPEPFFGIALGELPLGLLLARYDFFLARYGLHTSPEEEAASHRDRCKMIRFHMVSNALKLHTSSEEEAPDHGERCNMIGFQMVSNTLKLHTGPEEETATLALQHGSNLGAIYAMPCCAMLCYAMLAVLCYAMLWDVQDCAREAFGSYLTQESL